MSFLASIWFGFGFFVACCVNVLCPKKVVLSWRGESVPMKHLHCNDARVNFASNCVIMNAMWSGCWFHRSYGKACGASWWEFALDREKTGTQALMFPDVMSALWTMALDACFDLLLLVLCAKVVHCEGAPFYAVAVLVIVGIALVLKWIPFVLG